jgi:hypothetical protein
VTLKNTKLKKIFSLINTPQFVRTPFLISYLITFSLSLFVLVIYLRIQPTVPLFYSLARPTQHLVPKEWLFIVPALSGAISVSHLILINIFEEYDQLIRLLFSWTTVAIQIVLAVAVIRSILIVL